jgi:hypothetical protein
MRRAVARHNKGKQDRGLLLPDHSSNALRIRRHIERRKQGRKVYALELDEVNIEEMLIHEGLLEPGKDHDHKTVTAALTVFVSSLSEMRFGRDPETGVYFPRPEKLPGELFRTRGAF